jgi:hypothetical protein
VSRLLGWRVTCRDDSVASAPEFFTPQRVFATSQVFASRDDANAYAATVAASRDPRVVPHITAEYFTAATGSEPVQDDLERANCPCAGLQMGHSQCGWNIAANLPVFMAGPERTKRAPAFAVTFETVTEESAEHGDAADRGYVIEGATLRDCVPHVANGFSRPDWAGYCEPDASAPQTPRALTWDGYNDGTRHAYETGERESRTLHIPAHVTASSARRIARLFRAHGWTA